MKPRLLPIFAAMIPGLIWLFACHVQAADRVPTAAVATNQRVLATAPGDMHSRIYQTVMQYVQGQTQGYPGKVNIEIQPLDNRIRVADCDMMEAFAVQGTRLWGKTHIGIRCLQTVTKPWTLYVQADVQVWGEYAVTGLPVSQGAPVQASDIVMQNGDLTKLPAGIITDLAMLEGKKASMNMPLGTVLRPELLKAMPVIMQGQMVQLNSRGDGFVISADGTAMQTANVGQVVDVKVSSGQVIKGVAQSSGKVDVRF
ncbi:MAG TPA: flagellar basal body P-ring formation chaperone FlgA [Methylophilus sp.]|uniref:flagellar basal body P-ring formation chaperone FlgA n=1 Tax=Methylophilus sp. TaxID=29541 RepID=UPI002BB7E17C|nr:flagellar basal body P-ring formation chaperone FlgA [Methylophilus sp.]HSH87792.1 flagellar basal body P-ring formation chaperone FlgA [Methylophilus sp.]